MPEYGLNFEAPGSPWRGLSAVFPLLIFLALVFPTLVLFIPVLFLPFLRSLSKTAFPAIAGISCRPVGRRSLRGPPLTF